MLIKPAIIIIFILLLISLFSGLFYLMKDKGSSKRTLNSLSVRVILAATLLVLVSYGLFSGQITPHQPW
ncbi:DUF2909 family protein [Sinobacterium caligoides]|uniref:DUF2909 family protein n=1 Tax=Sinobacterium caligoides TaxID=933926 RepID=A0A3N2DGQ7_9GAMM|nr:twin transmembrane helix small protein [Sinobacterium caligoides]ROR98977.1 DUF2909 family protein [Sinobacterium caligoides]